MAANRGPRRGAPGRRGTTGRAGTRRGDQGSASTNRTGADPSATDRPGAGRSATDRSATGRPGTGRGNTGRGADLPRRTAYDVLAAVETRQAYANLLLPRLLAERGITGRDAALATELSYGTLRGLGTYDAVLAACSDRPLDKLDPPVLQVLRLGAHQLLATRVAAHAAVATSVDLARAVGGPRVSGYVNAVLRRVATRDLDAWLPLVAPDPAADAEGYLAVRYSYPRWIVAAYRDALGPAADTELAAALAAGNDRPRVTMAAFPGGPPREAIMPEGAGPTRWSPYGFTLAGGDPAPLVADGVAAVQDEASQLAAIALATVPLDGPDRLWLDMCAGPGGKARLLYGLAEEAGARLVAADLHEHRAALVRDALARTPHHGSGTTVITADGLRPPWPEAAFDRVLLDVPCSGLGALRRRPEARWRKAESDLPALAELQRALLRSALAACRPGGVVAYVTCSPVPAETRDVVTAVASSTPATEILDAPAVLSPPTEILAPPAVLSPPTEILDAPAVLSPPTEILAAPAVLSAVPDIRSPAPQFAQLWPHRHTTDAIFIALLRRTP